jgi:hypothetical protein
MGSLGSGRWATLALQEPIGEGDLLLAERWWRQQDQRSFEPNLLLTPPGRADAPMGRKTVYAAPMS